MSWFLGAYGIRGGRNGGIYNCRTIAGSSALSLHGEGRADDLMIPVGASWGQPLADALVSHSHELGIQLVIYRRRVWSGRYPTKGWRPFDGSNPHDDHIHGELSRASALSLTVERIRAALTPGPTWTERLIMNLPTLREGATGTPVKRVQVLVEVAGFDVGPVDGKYGPRTAHAVRAYQSSLRLIIDGVVGRQTWTALLTR